MAVIANILISVVTTFAMISAEKAIKRGLRKLSKDDRVARYRKQLTLEFDGRQVAIDIYGWNDGTVENMDKILIEVERFITDGK